LQPPYLDSYELKFCALRRRDRITTVTLKLLPTGAHSRALVGGGYTLWFYLVAQILGHPDQRLINSKLCPVAMHNTTSVWIRPIEKNSPARPVAKRIESARCHSTLVRLLLPPKYASESFRSCCKDSCRTTKTNLLLSWRLFHSNKTNRMWSESMMRDILGFHANFIQNICWSVSTVPVGNRQDYYIKAYPSGVPITRTGPGSVRVMGVSAT
jgi:hypothetical protein